MMGMKFWARVPNIVLVLVIGAAAIAAAIVFKPVPKPHAPKSHPLPKVEVVIAEPQTMAVNVMAQGTLIPRRQIDLVSQVAGVITQVAPDFISGGFFAQGKTLVQIDPRDYRVALARAEAALKQAEQQLATERGMVRQAKRQWRDLGDADANQLSLRKPQLAAAEAHVAAAQAERDQAQVNLERTRISLPFNGRINTTWVDLGQFVGMGSKIASVYDDASALVRLPLTDQQAALINLPLALGADPAQLPQVILRGKVAGQLHEWQGQITHTEASLDTQSRMYYAVVEIPHPFAAEHAAEGQAPMIQAPMIMGMYLEAEIHGKPLADVLRLPKGALFRRDKIYSLDDAQQVQEKTVQILRIDDDWVWVQGDIAQGDAIVLNRQGYLNPGAKVEIETKSIPEANSQLLTDKPANPGAAE
jgi:RND family efflux transporter MFP subunit